MHRPAGPKSQQREEQIDVSPSMLIPPFQPHVTVIWLHGARERNANHEGKKREHTAAFLSCQFFFSFFVFILFFFFQVEYGQWLLALSMYTSYLPLDTVT